MLWGSVIPSSQPFNPRIEAAARQRATIDMFIAAAAAIAVLAVACFDPRVFIDGDTNWHVAAGRWILTHRLVPQTDPFSFTYAGKPWIAHEWGSEVVMAFAYLVAGWAGVVLVIGLAAALAYALIAAELRLWMGPVGQAIGLALSFACLQPFLFARPHILAMPLLVFWTGRMLKARRAAAAPPLALTPLMALWANLHASFIFGLGVVGVFALEALIEAPDKLRALREWATFGLLATLFSLATPHGLAGLEFPFMVLGMRSLPNILEWRGAVFGEPTLFEGALLGAVFLGLWRGIKVPPLRLVLLAALVHMALQHVRQQAVLAALAPLLLAEPFGRALQPARDGPRLTAETRWGRWWRVPSRWVAILLALVAATVIGVRLGEPLVRRDNVNVPVSAMAHVPPSLLKEPVLNEYAFGGYLIFKGVRPFIDGRADMYGDDFVAEYLTIIQGTQPDVDRAFQRWGVRWTILSPRDGLVRLLDTRPGWRRLYADPYAVVQAGPAEPAASEPKGGSR